jgi:ankyrin repeat protein
LGEGATPFMRAAQGGDVALMRRLTAAGANATLTQKNGTTALMIAAGGQGDEAVLAAVQLCLEGGADVNAVDAAGSTALHRAAENGATAVIRLLAERGAVLDVKNTRGSTPLDLALASGREEDRTATVALLRELLARPR